MHASNYHRVPPGAGHRARGAAEDRAQEVEQRGGLTTVCSGCPCPALLNGTRACRLICLTNRDRALIV